MLERLVLIGVAGLTSGIIVRSFLFVSLPAFGLCVLVLILTSGGYLAYRARGYAYVSVFMVLALVGGVRTAVVPDALPACLESLVGTSVTLHTIVTADPDIPESTQRVRVAIDDESSRTQILVVLERYPILHYGDSLLVTGVLTRPDSFETDGGRSFDYPHFLAKDGVFGIIEHAHVEVYETKHSLGVTLMRTLYDARRVFEYGVSRAIAQPQSALALGLLTGGKQGLGKELLDAFTNAGLLPIVVLSGYNVMIVAEAVLRMFRFLPRKSALVLAGGVIAIFVLAAGAGSSAVRAGVMSGVGLFARATHRSYDALRALVLVFVLMILANPLLLVYDPGFQFSCIATLGLIVGSPLVARYLAWVPSTLLRKVLATTIAAQVCVLPLLLYETGNLSLVAVPANLLVLPFVPLAMLLSFIAGCIGMLAPAIATLAGLPAFLVLSYMTDVARALASTPLASVTVPSFPFLLVIVAYALLVFFVLRMKHTTPLPKETG